MRADRDPAVPETVTVEYVGVREGYARWSTFYDDEDNALIQLEDIHLTWLLGAVEGLRVLDLGCGTGRHAIAFAQRGAHVTGFDFSEEMLARARTKAGAEQVELVVHDFADPLPVPADTADLVLCCLVLEHIPDLRSMFAELQRVCRPGGHVVVSELHPAMRLRDVQAQFSDPRGGHKVKVEAHGHVIADYLMAARAAGLELEHIAEHDVDNTLVSRSPRAERYLGWPLLLLMKWAKG